MYRVILIPLENSPADQSILDHVRPLAKLHRSRLILLSVANGWAARNFDRLNLAESDEIKKNRTYLAQVTADLEAEGFTVAHILALGEPSAEIVKTSKANQVDLIAMSTHGHRFISDLFYGSTADKVRHLVDVPVLLLKAKN